MILILNKTNFYNEKDKRLIHDEILKFTLYKTELNSVVRYLNKTYAVFRTSISLKTSLFRLILEKTVLIVLLSFLILIQNMLYTLINLV